MQSLWKITVEDYLEIVKRCREAGLKAGDDMTPFFLQYMAEKNQKPIGANEFTHEELLDQLSEKHGNVLDISTNEDGKQICKIHKKKEENN